MAQVARITNLPAELINQIAESLTVANRRAVRGTGRAMRRSVAPSGGWALLDRLVSAHATRYDFHSAWTSREAIVYHQRATVPSQWVAYPLERSTALRRLEPNFPSLSASSLVWVLRTLAAGTARGAGESPQHSFRLWLRPNPAPAALQNRSMGFSFTLERRPRLAFTARLSFGRDHGANQEVRRSMNRIMEVKLADNGGTGGNGVAAIQLVGSSYVGRKATAVWLALLLAAAAEVEREVPRLRATAATLWWRDASMTHSNKPVPPEIMGVIKARYPNVTIHTFN